MSRKSEEKAGRKASHLLFSSLKEITGASTLLLSKLRLTRGALGARNWTMRHVAA